MKQRLEELFLIDILYAYLDSVRVHVDNTIMYEEADTRLAELFSIKPQWNTFKDVYLYLTGKETPYLTKTGKMSNGSFGFSAKHCKAGSYLVNIKNSICSKCYGLVGCYAWDSYKTKSDRTIESINKYFWKQAIVFIIKKKKFKEFRWFDNGDLQSDKMLEDIFYIARHTPDVKHWLPTKEYRMVKRTIQKGLHKPDNLDIRLSAFKINGKPPLKLAQQLGVNCSVALTSDEFKKRETKGLVEIKCHTAHSFRNQFKDNKQLFNILGACSGCTACYNNKVDVVYYEEH